MSHTAHSSHFFLLPLGRYLLSLTLLLNYCAPTKLFFSSVNCQHYDGALTLRNGTERIFFFCILSFGAHFVEFMKHENEYWDEKSVLKIAAFFFFFENSSAYIGGCFLMEMELKRESFFFVFWCRIFVEMSWIKIPFRIIEQFVFDCWTGTGLDLFFLRGNLHSMKLKLQGKSISTSGKVFAAPRGHLHDQKGILMIT